MKALISGDSHGNTEYVQGLLITAAVMGFDRVIQLGDFGAKSNQRGQTFLSAVSAASEQTEVRLDFIDGNHDDHGYLAVLRNDESLKREDGSIEVRSGVHYWPRGSVTTLAGRKVGFLGGTVSIDRHLRVRGETWWEEEAITRDDVDRLVMNCGGKALDLLLTHETIAGIPLPSKYNKGNIPADVEADAKDQRLLIAQAVEMSGPKMMIHGHWHIRYTHEYGYPPATTSIFGLGYEGSDAVLAIDFETMAIDNRGTPIPTLEAVWAADRS